MELFPGKETPQGPARLEKKKMTIDERKEATKPSTSRRGGAPEHMGRGLLPVENKRTCLTIPNY